MSPRGYTPEGPVSLVKCAGCGLPLAGSVTSRYAQEHVASCAKHPLAQKILKLEAENVRLREQLRARVERSCALGEEP